MKLDKRNKYLLVGLIAMLFLSYKLAIYKTILVNKELNTNLAKKKSIDNLPKQLNLLIQKDKDLNLQLAIDAERTTDQNNLLKLLSLETSKNKVKIIDFKAPHVIESGQGTIKTYMVELEGSYNNILKVANFLENKKPLGTISHLNFEKKKNHRTNRTYLQAKIFLERLH